MNDSLPSPAGLPTSYLVDTVDVAPNVVLAPMEGVTDLAFRRLVRSIGGPGLTYTEFIASKGLTVGDKRAWRMASFDADERPIALQIYGREPVLMAEAARLLQDAGATLIDINMGCPSKKVCQNSGGSALMREPDHAIEIVRAVKAAITVPLTVKMRSGFDPTNRNAPELAYRCQEEGAAAITIHWRTRADRYSGERTVDAIAEAVDRLTIPVVGNGDIVDIESAAAMFRDTGCAGVMVGRGAIQNPWLMTQIGQWLRGKPIVEVTGRERQRLLLKYYGLIGESFDRPVARLGRMKQITKYFISRLVEGNTARGIILRAQSADEMIARINAYFDRLAAFEGGDVAAFDGYSIAALANEAIADQSAASKAADGTIQLPPTATTFESAR
ncbi:MAG: tRNA-dihydrouridine synthase B [Myxococcota bacterium]